MANVLILNGSPRKNGATASLIKALIDGAKESGSEIKEDYITSMSIKPCIGCDSCMRTHKGCVQKDDDMAVIYEDMLWADIVVFASPVFCVPGCRGDRTSCPGRTASRRRSCLR